MRILNGKGQLAWLFFIAAAAIGLPQQTDSRAGVSGRVTNSATGAPILHAHVTLWGEQQRYGALTGADGKFSIAQLPGGQYSISVDAPGFQSPPIFWDAPTNRLVLRPAEHKDDLNLTLTPFGAISGRVIDAEGLHLQGMAISALSVEGVTEGGPSDPDGQYRISNLPPGKYRVQAAPGSSGNLAPEIRSDGTTEVHYAPTYYPSSLTMESAGPLDVSPGAERTGIDIRLVRAPIVAVQGTVSGIPAGEPNISLILARKIEPPLAAGGKSFRRMFADQRRVNPDGSFVIWRLDPGSYLLRAQSYREGWASPPVEIVVGGKDIGGVSLRLIALSDISGKILSDDRGALLPPTPPNASLAETPQISLQGRTTNSSYFSVIAADGSFHLTKVRPEQYSVYLSWGAWGAYVKSMRLGSTDIEGSILDLRDGVGGGALIVTASSVQGQISGVVRNAAGPAAYARIALLSEKGGVWDNPAVLTARSNGMYTFTNLAPGKFIILALDAGVANAGALRYHLQDYADIIESVEIHPGDRLTRNLRQHNKSK